METPRDTAATWALVKVNSPLVLLLLSLLLLLLLLLLLVVVVPPLLERRDAQKMKSVSKMNK